MARGLHYAESFGWANVTRQIVNLVSSESDLANGVVQTSNGAQWSPSAPLFNMLHNKFN